MKDESVLPTTGEMKNFETGARRDASRGKGIPSEIPPVFIRSLAKRLEDGAIKYDRGNWRKGIPLSRYYDALLRHAMLAHEGDDSEDHYGAMAFNVMGWLWTEEQILDGKLPKSLDDLPFRDEYRHDLSLEEREEPAKKSEGDSSEEKTNESPCLCGGGSGCTYEEDGCCMRFGGPGVTEMDIDPTYCTTCYSFHCSHVARHDGHGGFIYPPGEPRR